jgi:hypothetical protein
MTPLNDIATRTEIVTRLFDAFHEAAGAPGISVLDAPLADTGRAHTVPARHAVLPGNVRRRPGDILMSAAMLRAQLMMLKSRYDCYAFSPAIYAVVRNLEIEISWIEHGRDARSPRYPTLLASSRRVSSTA